MTTIGPVSGGENVPKQQRVEDLTAELKDTMGSGRSIFEKLDTELDTDKDGTVSLEEAKAGLESIVNAANEKFSAICDSALNVLDTAAEPVKNLYSNVKDALNQLAISATTTTDVDTALADIEKAKIVAADVDDLKQIVTTGTQGETQADNGQKKET